MPIPAEYRPLYKLAQIVLILEFCCQGRKCSLLKMHLLSDVLKTDERMNWLLEAVGPDLPAKIGRWNLEPTMNKALQIAVAEQLCQFSISTQKYSLEAKGRDFLISIMSDPDAFDKEKRFLHALGKKISDSLIQDIARSWSTKL